jgi:predicted Zn-dependent protease
MLPLLIALAGCMVHPVTLEREFNVVSEEREIDIGRGAHSEIVKTFGYYQDDQIQRYVYQVGQKLVGVCPRRDISYHFTVIDSDIENAFATPGGYVYISRGLLAIMNSEAELAGVLGHEIGHVAGRDSAALMSQGMLAQIATLAGAAGAAVSSGGSGGDLAMATNQLFNAIMLGFSREREYLADDQSIEYITACGYDPTQMLQFMRTLSQKSQGPTGVQQYLVTHPYIFDRMAHIEAKIKVMRTMRDTMSQIQNAPAQPHASGRTEAEQYKKFLDGLAYGPKDQMRRIKLYTVQPGDSLEFIARKTLGSSLKARELAYLNGTQLGAQLIPGATIKIIY